MLQSEVNPSVVRKLRGPITKYRFGNPIAKRVIGQRDSRGKQISFHFATPQTVPVQMPVNGEVAWI